MLNLISTFTMPGLQVVKNGSVTAVIQRKLAEYGFFGGKHFAGVQSLASGGPRGAQAQSEIDKSVPRF
jgi:hypothetical protein